MTDPPSMLAHSTHYTTNRIFPPPFGETSTVRGALVLCPAGKIEGKKQQKCAELELQQGEEQEED